MANLAVVLVSASWIAVVGCSKTKTTDLEQKLAELSDAMCRCNAGDAKCASMVAGDQNKWATEMAKTADKNAKPDPDEIEDMRKRIDPIMTQYTKCMTTAMTPVPKPTDLEKPAANGP